MFYIKDKSEKGEIMAEVSKKVAKAKTTVFRGTSIIAFPYFDQNKNLQGTRYRIALKGKEKFRWEKGSILCLYGLWRIKVAIKKSFVLLVEDEADCHTAWFNKFPALGVPGANNWNEDRDAHHFKNIATVFLVYEPDRGGDILISKLKNSSIVEKVKVITLGKYKGLSEMHIANPDKFNNRLNKTMKEAVSLKNVCGVALDVSGKALWFG